MVGLSSLKTILIALVLAMLSIGAALHEAAAAAKKPENPLDAPMRFVVVRNASPLCGLVCAEWISAEGTIRSDTPKKLKALLARLGKKKLPVIIHSPGGDVDGALATGRLIRSNGLDVAVGQTTFTSCAPADKGCKPDADGAYRGSVSSYMSMCNSACPWVLAGGKRRLVGPLAYLGVHQITTTVFKETVFYRTEYKIVKGKKKVVSKKITGRKSAGSYKTTKLAAEIRRRLIAYQAEMGMDPGFLDLSQKTPAKDISQLYLGQMVRMNLVTGKDDASTFAGAPICKTQPMPANCRAVPPPSPQEIAAAFVAGLEKSDAELAKDMRFVLVRGSNSRCEPLCPEWISAKGRLTPGAPDRLRKLLKSLGDRKPAIVISSLGGKADVAMELGRVIRKAGVDVVVGNSSFMGCTPGAPACVAMDGKAAAHYVGTTSSRRGDCLSECLLALAGGIERLAGVGTLVGWADTGAPAKAMADKREAYLTEMGVPKRMLDERVGEALTEWTQWRLAELRLLTGKTGVERIADAGLCGAAPANCRESMAKVQPAAAKVEKPSKEMARPAAGERSMEFVLVRGSSPLCDPNCPEWISAEGTIDLDSPRKFEQMLTRLGARRLPVVISSKGGDVIAAMAIGRSIRANRLDVAVARTRFLRCEPQEAGCAADDSGAYVGAAIGSWGECIAACPVVLAGGVRRLVGSSAYIGIHELALRPKLEAYFSEMGIDGRLLASMQEVRYLGPAKLEFDHTVDFRLATGRDSVNELAAPAICKVPGTANCRLLKAGG